MVCRVRVFALCAFLALSSKVATSIMELHPLREFGPDFIRLSFLAMHIVNRCGMFTVFGPKHLDLLLISSAH